MKRWLISLALLGTICPAIADWHAIGDTSSIYAVSIKSTHLAELHQFTIHSAQLTDTGNFTLKVELASVLSGAEHRNQLLQDVLFEVAKYPLVELSTTLSMDWLAELPIATVTSLGIDAQLALHGITQPLALSLHIVKLSESQFWVTNAQPVLLDLTEFGYQKGLQKLTKLSNLDSISTAVPLTFSLLMSK